jgi:hypothetical protein
VAGRGIERKGASPAPPSLQRLHRLPRFVHLPHQRAHLRAAYSAVHVVVAVLRGEARAARGVVVSDDRLRRETRLQRGDWLKLLDRRWRGSSGPKLSTGAGSG